MKRAYADLLPAIPHLSRVIAFDGNEGIGGLHRLREEIRGEGYDLILDMHDSLRSRYSARGGAASAATGNGSSPGPC